MAVVDQQKVVLSSRVRKDRRTKIKLLTAAQHALAPTQRWTQLRLEFALITSLFSSLFFSSSPLLFPFCLTPICRFLTCAPLRW